MFTNTTNRTPRAITVLLGNRPPPRATARQSTSAFVRVSSVAQPTSAKVAVFNAQSIDNKFAAICDRITAEKPSFCTIVETWHDSADCPSIIACTPLATIVLRGLTRVQQPSQQHAYQPWRHLSAIRKQVRRSSHVAASLQDV